MKISDFVKTLLPFFNRTRVQDDLRNTTTEYNTLVLPAVTFTAKEVKGPLKSEEGKYFMAAYKQAIRTNASNYIVDLATRLTKLGKTLDAVTQVVNGEFEDKVATVGLSVRKANAVRVLSAISFINKYTMSLLNATLHYELKAAGLSSEYVSDVTEGELLRLKKYLQDYLDFVNNLTTGKDPIQAFADIPDVIVEAEAHADVFGREKLDPFGVFGQTNFRGSPFYFGAMMVAEYHNRQYRKMEAQKSALEKRVIALRRSSQGQNSAKLEVELEGLTSKIARLAEEVRTYEEALA